MLPDKEKLKEITKELQKLLKIQDWDIEVDYCGDKKIQEFSGDFSYACCERDMRLHRATVYINKDHEGVNEWYSTLMHELFHVVTQNAFYHAKSLLNYIPDETTRSKEKDMFDNYYEQLIEDLARSFSTVYPVTNFIKEDENVCTFGK